MQIPNASSQTAVSRRLRFRSFFVGLVVLLLAILTLFQTGERVVEADSSHVKANCCNGFGFSLFTGNNAASAPESGESAVPMPRPVNTPSTWVGPSGNWSNAANWSSNPNFPNNGQPMAGNLYDATLENGDTITRNIPITIQNFTLNSGIVSGANSLTINQVFNWSSGTITGVGSMNIASTGVVNLFGDSLDILDSTTLNNSGIVNVTNGSQNFYLDHGAIIQNNNFGVINLQNSGDTFVNFNGNNSFVNNAGATLRKSSSGDSNFGLPITNNGVVDVQNGTLVFDNPIVLNSGSTLTGGGIFRLASEMTINGAISSPQTFEFYGFNGLVLSITNGSSLSIASGRIFNWNYGNITGPGNTNIANGGVLNLVGPQISVLTNTTLNNAGTINMASGSHFGLVDAATIQNNSGGVFDLQNSGNTFTNFDGNSSFVNNAGATLRKSSILSSDFYLPLLNNGFVDVQQGTLNLNQGGSGNGNFHVAAGALLVFNGFNDSYNLSDGARFTGDGYTQLGGGIIISTAGTVTAHRFRILGGTLSTAFASSFVIGNGDILDFDSGIITGAGSTNIASGGVMNLSGFRTGEITNTTLNNAGTVNLTSSSQQIYLRNAATIKNNGGGVFDLQNSADTFVNIDGNSNFMNNFGATLRKSSSGGSSFGIPVANNGTVDVQRGVLDFNPGYTQTEGILSLSALASVSASASASLDVQGGQVIGNGTVIGSLNNSGGVISPGFSVGTLTVTGGLSFGDGSSYNCELNSNSAAADKIVANGVSIAPGSTLSLTDLGNSQFPPVPIIVIDNMSADPIDGQFSNFGEGQTVRVNANTFKVSYVGGDGNDLALTLVAITGTVTYGNAIGAPSPRFVSNVAISGAGTPPVSVLTAGLGLAAGTYSLTGFGTGSYTVTPTKSGGVNGITSFDAARIAQHVAGTVLLNATQLSVADVSNNGSVTSFDAGQIAKFVAGPPYVPPGIGATGTWRFSPVNRNYASVTSSVTGEDFSALLMGEVSGNWANTGARPSGSERSAVSGEQERDGDEPPRHSLPPVRYASTPPQAGGELRLPPLLNQGGELKASRQLAVAVGSQTTDEKEIVVPVNVQGVVGKGIISYEFDLRYDPAVVQPLVEAVDLKGTVSRGLSVVVNPFEPGLLRVVVYGALPIGEDGVLLNLRFAVVGHAGMVSPLTFERIMFNEGEPEPTATDGRVELSAANSD